MYHLDRPSRAALPASYFWTWDHYTNWVLDDPGIQAYGACNPYLKRPETFLEDYRRLSDFAAGIGIKGLTIWGFLRDSHGGADYAKRVAGYAAAHGLTVSPGLGVTWYGGPYYEGDHPYNLDTFLRKNPEARMLDEHGRPFGEKGVGESGACPAHPLFQAWLAEGMGWMLREFEIGGFNLENGDFLVDHHPLTQSARKEWPADDPPVFFFQGYSYRQALRAMGDQLDRLYAVYATYTGFRPSASVAQNAAMGQRYPAMLDLLPQQSVCQWTLTGMLRRPSLPLMRYLDDGAPAEALDSPGWPAGLKPPAGRRHVGFLHQGSYWDAAGRTALIIGTIKEACLRAARAGLEGVGMEGGVTCRHIPAALNYLALSHFSYWPEDSLRGFARKTLAQVLGSAQASEDFVEILARWEAGMTTDADRKGAAPENHGFGNQARMTIRASDIPDRFQRFLFWRWLSVAISTPGYTPLQCGGLEY